MYDIKHFSRNYQNFTTINPYFRYHNLRTQYNREKKIARSREDIDDDTPDLHLDSKWIWYTI